MEQTAKAVLDSKPEKKSFWRMLGNFMLYGGWMLVVFLVLILMIALSHK